MSGPSSLRLASGATIPQLGFGVFQVPPGRTVEAVSQALSVGYRHVDTAEMYGNEREVGEAVRASGIPRSDVYVTSKLSNTAHLPDDARRAFERTLVALDLGYVDLFLIHWPLPSLYGGDYLSTWRALEGFFEEGLARSIGVSNFEEHHLRRLLEFADVPPAVNQVELHPYLARPELRAFHAAVGVVSAAWSPLAQGRVLSDPVVVEVARRVGRSPAQVVLRWHLQRGDLVAPRSLDPARIREDFALFDFELGVSEMALLDGLDRGESGRLGSHPDVFDWVPV